MHIELRPLLRRWIVSAALSTFLTVSYARGEDVGVKIPELAQIKEKAEQGDPQAQEQLGNTYDSRGDRGQAFIWYQKAADQGMAGAQHKLGQYYMGGRSTKPGEPRIPKNQAEAIKWISKAANQGHFGAQMEFGSCYETGVGVKKDDCEAYKWYAIAGETLKSVATPHLNRLILRMTREQIEEGRRRADSFLKGQDSTPSPAHLFAQLKLKGISRFGQRQTALINDRSFESGQSGTIKVEGRLLKLRCIEIKTDSVVVNVEGLAERKELFLSR